MTWLIGRDLVAIKIGKIESETQFHKKRIIKFIETFIGLLEMP